MSFRIGIDDYFVRDDSKHEEDEDIQPRCTKPLQHRKYDKRGFLEHFLKNERRRDDNMLELTREPHGLRFGEWKISYDLSSFLPKEDVEAVDHRSSLTHYLIYEVDNTGHADTSNLRKIQEARSRAETIWQLLSLSGLPDGDKNLVGRIAIVIEPSPVLLGVLHYTMSDFFDMNEALSILRAERSTIRMNQAFHEDERRSRTCVVSFNQLTCVEIGHVPSHWQLSDGSAHVGPWSQELHLSRCCTTVAFHLGGPIIGRLRNKSTRLPAVFEKYGSIYSALADWQVLSIEANPDWLSTIRGDPGSKRYLSGPEAFLSRILVCLEDFWRRSDVMISRLSELIQPPVSGHARIDLEVLRMLI